MATSRINRTGKKRRGRPATNPTSIHLTLLPDRLSAVDDWIERQTDAPSRPEAIRRLVELGLTVAPRQRGAHKGAAKAKAMADDQLERMTDPAASPDEQQQRKRRLLKGPSEFREMRGDLPKAKGR